MAILDSELQNRPALTDKKIEVISDSLSTSRLTLLKFLFRALYPRIPLGLAVAATVKDSNPLLLLFGQLFAQLCHHLFHRSTQVFFIGAIAIQ